jgi:hypothetical protein
VRSTGSADRRAAEALHAADIAESTSSDIREFRS